MDECEIEMNLNDNVDLNIGVTEERMQKIEDELRDTMGKEFMGDALAILCEYGINIRPVK